MHRSYDRLVSRLSRRELMKVVGLAGAAAIAHPIVGRGLLAQPLFASYPFTLGVASGDPLPDAVVIWTRLAPRPLEGGGMPMTAVQVAWEVAGDAGLQSIVKKGVAVARPEVGHSVHVDVTGLQPGREYWYRFTCGTEVSRTGRTKTAPASGARVDRLRFAVCGCANYEMGYFTACRHIAEEDLDFVFFTGDYIYESRADGGRRDTTIRQHLGDEIFTVVDYRNRYAQYKMDRDLMAAHASAPFIVTWDDHEVDNDYAGDRDERGTPPEVFLLRRAAAYQAYYESMPLRASTVPSGPHMRLFRRLQFGALIDLHILDTRQWRSGPACGGGNQSHCAEALDPRRTILGAEQEAWLFGNLSEASGVWTVLGQQVPTYVRDTKATSPNGRFSMDKWDGYAASRDRLYARLQETRAPNPVVLSGDVHVHYGADLKADYTNPRSPIVGVELTNSSITSNGDGSDVNGDWPKVKPDNPHIKFHSARRGYISCTATPQALRADFKILPRVSLPDQPISTAGSLIVEAGHPGAKQA
jgi:alkaline phosphatase D